MRLQMESGLTSVLHMLPPNGSSAARCEVREGARSDAGCVGNPITRAQEWQRTQIAVAQLLHLPPGFVKVVEEELLVLRVLSHTSQTTRVSTSPFRFRRG